MWGEKQQSLTYIWIKILLKPWKLIDHIIFEVTIVYFQSDWANESLSDGGWTSFRHHENESLEPIPWFHEGQYVINPK